MVSAGEREYQEWEGAAYFLPCDTEESQRLTLQHDVVLQVLDGALLLLPPAVVAMLDQPSAHVLDVGTGNGVWLHAFQTQISSLPSLTGIDITTKMFPTTHPKTMSFENRSAIDLPHEWSDQFDLVHQRFLIAGLTVQQWPVAIAESFRVTKPGSWLHLVEINAQNIAVGPNSMRLAAALDKLFEMKGVDPDQTHKLPGLVTEAGWVDMQVHDREWPLYGNSEMETAARKAAWRGHLGLKGAMVKLGLAESEGEFDGMMQGVEREWATIKGKSMFVRIITARKPEKQ